MRYILFFICIASSPCSQYHRNAKNKNLAPRKPQHLAEQPKPPKIQTRSFRVESNSSTYSILKEAGLSSRTILALNQASQEIRPLKRIGLGETFHVSFSQNMYFLTKIEWQITPEISIVFTKGSNNTWQATQVQKTVTTNRISYKGKVQQSLWSSSKEAGANSKIIMQLTEIFAWQIDFSREVQKGDKWRVVVEEKSIDGNFLGYGNILAAEYHGRFQKRVAILHAKDGNYYDPSGESLRSLFLKSPLKYGRVTSGFSKSRFHPILKKNRPHNGVDYGAPRGTPIMAVGQGQVTFAGRRGGSGKLIKIRHNSIYQTAYHHLHKIAKNIRRGTRVKQGQIIGQVGSTGLATGPHLHFAFYERGRFIDPLNKKFTATDPIPHKDLRNFQKKAIRAMAWLPPWQSAEPTMAKNSALQWEGFPMSYF